jgi:hypothetical protein
VALVLALSGTTSAESWPWDNAVSGVSGPLCSGQVRGEETSAAGGVWHNRVTITMACSAIDPATGQKLQLPWALGFFRPDHSLYVGVILPGTTGEWDRVLVNVTPPGTWTLVACAQDPAGAWGCANPSWPFPVKHAATPAPAPKVTSTAPAAEATGVGRNAVLRVRFNHAIVRPPTSNVRLVDLDTRKRVAVRVSLSGTTIVVAPFAKLAARHHFQLTLSGLRGTNGTPSSTVKLAFTTAR